MSWILDLVFFLLLILGTAYGVYKGFVGGILKLTTIWFALIFAFLFCVGFSGFLETCFGMTTAIARGIEGAISKNELYKAAIGADTPGADIAAVLEGMNIDGIARWFISISFGKMESVPAEATPAMMIASITAKWISIAISFVALVLIIKFGSLLIKLIFRAIASGVKPLRVIDQILGGILGLAESLILIFILMLIMNWLPVASLHEFISSSAVVGKIFASGWFQSITSYAISGKWFTDFIGKLLAN